MLQNLPVPARKHRQNISVWRERRPFYINPTMASCLEKLQFLRNKRIICHCLLLTDSIPVGRRQYKCCGEMLITLEMLVQIFLLEFVLYIAELAQADVQIFHFVQAKPS